MKSVVQNSFILQSILELAMYGYRLSPDWRSYIRENSLQDALAKFRSMISRWERFEYTKKICIDTDRYTSLVINGVLANVTPNQQLQFYRVDQGFSDDSSSSNTREISPWIEHPRTNAQDILFWDESQDLMVLRDDTHR
jgi:hypothetical protein